MLGGVVATSVLIMVVGLLIVLLCMGAGVWVWLRHRAVMRQQRDQQ